MLSIRNNLSIPDSIVLYKFTLSVTTSLFSGYPRFRIPAVEPFDLPALDIAKGQGAVSIDLSLQKIKVHGLTSAIINTLK